MSRVTLRDRFWRKVSKRPGNGCWEWQGAKARGYGYINVEGVIRSAHRVAYELEVGAIPVRAGKGKLFVNHHCDNRACVRPGHLFLGPQRANMEDMCAKDRQCRGERNGHAKLTEDDVLEIRRRARVEGLLQKHIAKEFNVSPSLICQILSGGCWKHLLPP